MGTRAGAPRVNVPACHVLRTGPASGYISSAHLAGEVIRTDREGGVGPVPESRFPHIAA